MEIYGKPYIKENGTMDRVSCKGNAYTCPAFICGQPACVKLIIVVGCVLLIQVCV